MNWLDRYLPCYDSDVSGAAEPPETGGGAPPPEAPVGEGRQPAAERRSIREELQANFDAAREPEKPAAPERGEKGRFKKRSGEGEASAEPGAAAAAGEAPQEGASGEAATTPEAPPATGAPAAPAGWSKEAKAAWGELPEPVRAAVAKREADVQKGVDQLKAGYADIDRAISPHDAAIRQHGHTRAQAIDQLFGWFRALASNPTQAFPALAKSFNIDLAQFAQAGGAAPPQVPAAGANGAAAPAPGQPEAVSPAIQQYIDAMQARQQQLEAQINQRFGTLEQTFAQQNEAKTHEVLAAWAKDKPHFEEVRQTMSRLIASGEVPLKEGRVDLDGAYETAIWAVPGVREKVLADQAKAAEAKRAAAASARAAAVQAEADKARKAGVSVTGGAPGAAGPAVAQPKGKGKSVRESLMEARAEVEGR
jgi:hypothetical protein